ncbi:pentapeptide repeat-containing protein [Agrobacterium tumefaciens]|uniref:pentapeptide repeat-containing protein n=1 Tax=Agrobacterium tumefaciens TaxID=358 RepID=UPI00384DF13B
MFDRLRALCAATTNNLAELADLAAPGDPAFFDGAQLSGADLRDTNLKGFHLQGALLADARIDETTILPDTTSLLNIKRDDISYAVHVIYNISSGIEKEVISSLDNLEKIASKQRGSDIRGPISRRSSNIPLKNDNERNFRLSAIRRMRRLANEIIASRESDLTIGGILRNVERLVAMIIVCESVLKKYEPRVYQRISGVMKTEVERVGALTESPDGQIAIDRQQWKAILSRLPATISGPEMVGELLFKTGSGDILANLLLRIFVLLEDAKDLYLTLPADQKRIDPISFQIQLEECADDTSVWNATQGSYAM